MLVHEDAHRIEAIAPDGERIVLQWRGAVVGVHHVARLLVQARHPCCKLCCIRQGRGQEHLQQQHITSRQRNPGEFYVILPLDPRGA